MALAASVLRARRRAAGLSQEQLAELCRVSERTIRNLERGTAKRPHRETLDAIAAALGITGLAADEFVASWRSPMTGDFLEAEAQEEALTRDLIAQRRQVREIAVSHVLVVGDGGRWKHEVIRRTFEALRPGVDTFAWMVSFDADAAIVDPDRLTVGACANVEVVSASVLPVTGAKAFIGSLGRPLDLGEVRTIEYRLEFDDAYRTERRAADDDELLFAAAPGPELLTLEARFDPAALPARVFAVRQQTVNGGGGDAGERTETEARCSPFGVAELVVRPASSNVYGLRWEWDGAWA